MHRLKILAVAVLAFFLAASLPTSTAQAQVNGGFESGLTGWTPDNGNCGRDLVASTETYVFTNGQPLNGGSTGATHSGNYALWLGATGCQGGIFQTLATTPGQTYTVSYWARVAQLGQPNELSVGLGSSAQGTTFNDVSALNYQQYSFNWTADSNQADLRVMGQDDPSGVFVDDINVTTTPEPSSLALLGTGLIGLVPVVGRRARRTLLN